MAQLLVERDTVEPAVIAYLQARISAAQDFATQGPDQAREVGSTVFFLQNSLKAYQGRYEALLDKSVMQKKQDDENDLRTKVDANPDWKAEYGDAWDTIARLKKM